MLRDRQARQVNLSREVSPSTQNLVGVIENFRDVFLQPSFYKRSFFSVKLLILKCDADVLQDIQGNKTLRWAIIGPKLNDILDRCLPTSVVRMQSQVS